jgi:UDP-glucuronate 4-epimerase
MQLLHERVLVTGAAGFIGSHLVDRLLQEGASVVGVDNFDPFYSAVEKRANLLGAERHPAFALVETDCRDLDALDRVDRGTPFTAIVHLAAKAGVRPSLRDPFGYLRTNVTGTQVVLEYARRRNIRRVVFASSSSVYGEAMRVPFDETDPADAPISIYAATKRAGEHLCATHAALHDAAVIALRFFTVYGPRQRPDLAIRKFATALLEGRPLQLHGDGTSSRDYTWIDDIIDGVVGALRWTAENPGRFDVVNLGGNRTTTLAELVRLLEMALGAKASVERLPQQPGDVSRTFARIDKAQQLFEYAPKVDIATGIPLFADWILRRLTRRAPERRRAVRMSVIR